MMPLSIWPRSIYENGIKAPIIEVFKAITPIFFSIFVFHFNTNMKTIDDFNFQGKKALIRVDFNVPLNENLEVTDLTRIEAAKPTILKILEDGGSAVLMSHLGRPSGVEEKFSLKSIVEAVGEVIGVQVKFVGDCIGEEVQQAVTELQNGEVLLLENLRFHKEEKAGDRDFAQELAKNGDIYVNDAFGSAHMAHASTAIIAEFFPDAKCFGYLLAKEIESLERVLGNSEKPVTAILGGSKVSSKITVIENILDKIDHLIIGGGIVGTEAAKMAAGLGADVTIMDNASIKGAVIGQGATIGRNTIIMEGSVIGDYVTIQDNLTICRNVNVCNCKTVNESVSENTNVI